MKEILKTLNKYDNFKDTFKYAYIGLPKGFGGLKENYYGSLNKFKKKYPDFKTYEKLPLLIFIHGSAGLNKGVTYRKWIVENTGFIFFAPNSFKLKDRPTYGENEKIKTYEKVHKVRQAEIHYNLEKLKEIPFIDQSQIFLMGNSEGGLAAAAYDKRRFKARIITAYSCENGYYSRDFKLGAKKNEPILNIIGTHDQFFSNDSKANEKHEVDGHCTKALMQHKNAKVIILPQTKHDITQNIYVKDEIIHFLKFWSK